MKEKNERVQEAYRPQFHYTAQEHIINDPNGLVYYKGEYHLMHQYNVHNQIYWGHGVSRDLLHWKRLPPALAPDEIGQIWSGSAVVDWNNTSGLQEGEEKVLAALFTYNEHVDVRQSQGLAYSCDRGRSWRKYKNNPVLIPEEENGKRKDFRDPKVFWYEPLSCWIMALACFDQVEFYRSPNLIQWEFSGKFGQGQGSHEGVWECPDLFEMPVEGEKEETRWVLTVSINNGAPAGGTGMQYFIGEFNGKTFRNENPPEQVLWMDYGKDFYAGVTWNDIPEEDKRRLMIGWSDNWLYRDALPTAPFKGQLSFVRELYLKRTGEGLRIFQQPVRELENCRNLKLRKEKHVLKAGEEEKLPFRFSTLDFSCELETPEPGRGKAEIRLSSGEKEFTRIGYDFQKEVLYVDRRYSGLNPHEAFPGVYEAPVTGCGGKIDLRILIDVSQIEIFAKQGEKVMTNLLFPENYDHGYGISLHAGGASGILAEYEAWDILIRLD